MAEQSLQQVLDEYYSLGINNQIDWEKFYLYSIITHSTAIEGSTVTEVEAQLLFDEGITSSKRTMMEQMMNLDLKVAYDYGREWISKHEHALGMHRTRPCLSTPLRSFDSNRWKG